MFNWFKKRFKSRAQRDRERGYYDRLSGIDGATLEEINERTTRRRHSDKRLVKLERSTRKTTFRERWGGRRHKWPSLKEILIILFPFEWLDEKLWPRFDPQDANERIAPRAGCYDADTGNTYDCNHKLIRRGRDA